MFVSNEDQSAAADYAKEIAKYAFALSFFLGYQRADAEIERCRANLDYFVKKLLEIGVAK